MSMSRPHTAIGGAELVPAWRPSLRALDGPTSLLVELVVLAWRPSLRALGKAGGLLVDFDYELRLDARFTWSMNRLDAEYAFGISSIGWRPVLGSGLEDRLDAGDDRLAAGLQATSYSDAWPKV